jgi:geranylgeranyl reductase family protein
VYDAIVVGAGPAGSTAAIVLAQSGARTLLIDREAFPREKACGDAVPISCFEILQKLGITFQESDDFLPVSRVFVEGPHGAKITLQLTEYPDISSGVVSRYVFDHRILERAKACGAEFCQMSVQGPIIEDGKVVGIRAKVGKQITEFRAKVVIAADGATSVIARALNGSLRSDKFTAVALRGYVETDVDLEKIIELVFLKEVQPGYAWFFPMGKRRANIGVGMRSDDYKSQKLTLQDMLDAYINTASIKARVGKNLVTDAKSWQIPLCLTDQKRVFDGAILAGDAGGFVDPLTGAGIHQAVVTGKRAAESALQAIQANDTSAGKLAVYDTLWKQDMGADMKRSAFVYNAASQFPVLIDATILIGKAVPVLMPKLLGKI